MIVRLCCILLPVLAAAADAVLPNPLREAWPDELVCLPTPSGWGDPQAISSVMGMGEPRAVQVLRLPHRDGDRDYLCFRATMPLSADGRPAQECLLTWSDAEPPASPLDIRVDGEHWLLANGLAELRLHRYPVKLPRPVPLRELPHWLTGCRLTGAVWDGAACFHGDASVSAVECQVRAQGPVLIELAWTYHFVQPDDPPPPQPSGGLDSSMDSRCDPGAKPTTTALRLLPGKQTHRFPPAHLPVDVVPRLDLSYEVVLRISANDPWIEVLERCHLPKGHGWELPLGRSPETDLDTVLWTRWFEYDRFGGNARQLAAPAALRPEQLARPYALLSPRWHQGGGGAQELFLTKSGDQAPAYGVVASHPSKWVCPSAIVAQADAPRRGFHFPLGTGDQGQDPGDQDQRWHQTRSWALVLAKRAAVEGNGRINSLIRRHSDWTLTALAERYVLDWQRDPAAAGPHLAVDRARFLRWQQILAGKAEGPEADLLRTAATDPELGKDDLELLALLRGSQVKPPGGPDPRQYLTSRYQDDSVNPTNFGTRTLVNRAFPRADLLTVGRPFGDARTAAIGYIFTDLDAWPGWRHGWHPGNPNFHTDKYQAALYAGACMPDHPHAAEWLAFGKAELLADLARTLRGPDAVGYECPGYAGYALGMQLELVRVLAQAGGGNLVAEDPRFLATAEWHRHLLTPPDPRLGGLRHEAPLGDTHRLFAGIGRGFMEIAALLAETQPEAAARLLAAQALAGDHGKKPSLLHRLIGEPHGIKPADPSTLDWCSRAFAEFGAVLRDSWGEAHESHVTLKAGAVHGHYHNEELGFHAYLDGRPVALDYHCSYHPRGDHAALHNTATFGHEQPVQHNARGTMVAACEQLHGRGRMLAVALTPGLDAVLAERSGQSLALHPIDPHDAEFARAYPRRDTGLLAHRRCLVLLKRPGAGDCLVVQDSFTGTEPAQVNLHLLARGVSAEEGGLLRLRGQLDRDLVVACFGASGAAQQRQWAYVGSDRHPGPGEPYALRAGETWQEWEARLRAHAAGHGVDSLPLAGFEQRWLGKDVANPWLDVLRAQDLRGLQVPPLWSAGWSPGEYQTWLRWPVPANGCVIWALAVQDPVSPAIAITPVPDGVSIVSGARSDELRFVADGDGLRLLHRRDGGALQEIALALR